MVVQQHGSLARKATGRQQIVSLSGGWHGRTAACLAVTDGPKYEAGARRAGVPLSRKVPFNDSVALAQAVDDSVAAVLIEPVQGLTGARDCFPEFLRAARAACDRVGAALIFDEIQCGVGRSGAFTAAEVYGVTPDIPFELRVEDYQNGYKNTLGRLLKTLGL